MRRQGSNPIEPDRPRRRTQRGITAMHFMTMAKATKHPQAGVMPEEKLTALMAKHHEEPRKTSAQLDASGLQPTSEGSRMKDSGGRRMVIDGPFAETKEVMGGHILPRRSSRKRRPN